MGATCFAVIGAIQRDVNGEWRGVSASSTGVVMSNARSASEMFKSPPATEVMETFTKTAAPSSENCRQNIYSVSVLNWNDMNKLSKGLLHSS